MTHALRAAAEYPATPAARDRWIVARRPGRHRLSPDRPHGWFVEDEVDGAGVVRRVATILLVNRECPFHCVMCDLWRDTLTDTVPPGAITGQIAFALSVLPPVHTVKLYNSGSFFDPQAVPPAEYAAIAVRLAGIERVIVECHPAFVGDAVGWFRDLVAAELEVAVGLETANEDVLARLNKRMTLASYVAAAERLRALGVAQRAFILVQPPFQEARTSVAWAVRSAEFAFDHRAGAASLIAVRPGNGALEMLAGQGDFAPPRLATLEAAFEEALALGRGRVFADTWDLARIPACVRCRDARVSRLRAMNLAQRSSPRAPCDACDGR